MVALGLVMDFDARTTIPFEGERHNALNDARYQAKYVSAIWQKLLPSQADFLMFNPYRRPPAIVAAVML
ncbi:endodeoxyribonuclease [Escherichia coli EPECa14]|nr:endodeoxyribonuclease [Escherichia coli EPECa14]